MAVTRWRPLAMAVAVTACLIGTIVITLVQHVPNRVERPLNTPQPHAPEQPVPVQGSAYLSVHGIDAVHRRTLVTADVGQLASHREIALQVATHGTYPALDRAQLVLEGTRCVYRTARGALFPNNALLTFFRDDRCLPLSGTPTGNVILTIRLRNVASPAIWTDLAGTAPAGSNLLFVDRLPGAGGPSYSVRGRVADSFDAGAMRRIVLLAYVWQVGNGEGWIGVVVALSALLLFAGTYGFWTVRAEVSRVREAARRGTAGFCLAAGLAGLYMVITPPFQAPDEPSHLAAFAAWAGRPELVAEAAEWARIGHVPRIQFRVEERFRVSDVGHPGEAWSEQPVPDADIRGKGIYAIWHALPPPVRRLPAPRLLLALRAVNVLVFSFAAGVSVAATVLFSGLALPHLLAVPLFLVPTLPFFGMHLSNHAPLVAAYVFTAFGVVLMVVDRKGRDAAGLMVGVGWSVAFLISRSAIPLGAFVGVLLAARLVLGTSRRGTKGAFGFWLGLGGPVVLVLAAAEHAYLTSIADITRRVLPSSAERLLEMAWAHPSLLLPGFMGAAAAETGVARLREGLPSRVRNVIRTLVRAGAVIAAVTVAAVMVGSLFVHYPVLERTSAYERPPAGAYARQAVLAGATIVRISEPDYLTSVTFWGAFGWLETVIDPRVISLLAGASGAGLILLLLRLAWMRDTRSAMYVAAAVVGYGVCLAAYAASMAPQLAMDLVGRYLVGLYLAMLLICWSSIALVTSSRRPRLAAWICACAAIGSAVLHADSFRSLLLRYF